MLYISIIFIYRLLLVTSLLLSPFFAMKPSKIHIIKLTSMPYYTLNCSKTSGTCKYVSMLDPQKSRTLAKQFSQKSRFSENFRSKGGRKILSSPIAINGFEEISKQKKNYNSQSKVNIIPYGPGKYPGKSVGITKKDRISDNEIIRPELNFISNARPAMLKWRDLDIAKTPIVKPSEIKKYRSRTNKKSQDCNVAAIAI